ncbi:uncharacterized protein LOC125669312 isoform X1 [Ostrea edulis]|uniref:uncharacterized protein LOC125669312 isoform X1 n=1 Tax=Ostrea edulis TaxID=37623 RepID=UPI0024AF43C9|nr:uncharacterized protein LOC125669312 isoform X1 [Ostrea edulis]XP_056013604.1 uncharacterized protein LOC125669312 isoform X1 [Ostrea edulis]
MLDVLKKSNPSYLVNQTCEIIGDECEKICKRNSGSVLQDRTYHGILNFSWDELEGELQTLAPNLLQIVKSIVSDKPSSMSDRCRIQMLNAIACALHARSREMTALQYLTGLILLHGGCTQRDIDRLAKMGVTVLSDTLHKKLGTWQVNLDEVLIQMKQDWLNMGKEKYQLAGGNWDKNILPSYRTSQQKTISLHLFTVVGVVDRISPPLPDEVTNINSVTDLDANIFIPSLQEQNVLRNELTFLVASALVNNIDQLTNHFKNIYPQHLEHQYSHSAGIKTKQYCLGLFDCNEQKTQDVIQLLKELQDKYVPVTDGDIKEEVFFGGDRLTDERIQCAQQAMENENTSLKRLEGFISKIEDFHRLMNFLEAICKLTFSTSSGKDRGTAYFFRNLLNCRNIKGDVKNSYWAYKMLYYTIFDGICCVFLRELNLDSLEDEIPFPPDWDKLNETEKVEWLNTLSENIVKKWFFESADDLCQELRDIMNDPDHEENYWTSNYSNGRFKCHFCDKTYIYSKSLQTHELKVHSHNVKKQSGEKTSTDSDEVFNYVMLVFKLVALHRNLDSAVDMGDGMRSVRSAKYEAPIYNKTNKLKYLIGSVHLTALVSGTLPNNQSERLIWNRFINISGGKMNNMAIDEYVELVNRETKNTCSGYQTKESIVSHSREFPHLIDATKHVDAICDVHKRKGFHKKPSYVGDVKKVASELIRMNAFDKTIGRTLGCREIVSERNPFDSCYSNFTTMIHRHKPVLPFRRLRNERV